ncbi:hypothetical protein AB0M91_17675 [Micromonospora rifamycinica]|uniref:hypothetical protein n=1 Tax=Micromonospora rifamycinica TaxID=291594 RepID=UPI003418723F
MPEVYGDEPKPWILASGFSDDSDLAEALRRQSAKVVFLREGVHVEVQVRQSDYDAIVAVGACPSVEDHLYVLQFGKSDSSILSFSSVYVSYGLNFSGGLAEKLVGPDSGVPVEAAELARRSLAPFLRDRRPRDLLLRYRQEQFGSRSDDEGIAAFVREYNGSPCAGVFARRGGSPWWWLPGDAPDQVDWLNAAFAEWRRLDEERFPSGPIWAEREPWLTATEKQAQRDLDDHASRERKLLEELDSRKRELMEARENARSSADAVERQLLTAQGDALVAEVKAVLEEIGFTVIDSDGLAANAAEKVEDLRVSADSWVALAEVKGYSGRRTAKTSDLLQIGRAAMRYAAAEGRVPDAQWYVVNQQAGGDPASRPRPLASNAGDVEGFARAGGLIIDTADLFRLREAVREGVITRDAAFERLKASIGVFAFGAD